MAGAKASVAPHMEAAPPPTDVPPPEVAQQPDLAGTLLKAEHFLGPDLRLQAMTDGTFCLVTSSATTPVGRATFDTLLASHQAKSRRDYSSYSPLLILRLVSPVRENIPRIRVEGGRGDGLLTQHGSKAT